MHNGGGEEGKDPRDSKALKADVKYLFRYDLIHIQNIFINY